MIDVRFFKKDDIDILEMAEENYEKLAKLGIYKNFVYKKEKLIIDGDEYEEEVIKLTYETRQKFEGLLVKEIIKTLEGLLPFGENFTIKEIRQKFGYVGTLLKLNKSFKDDKNMYFSY